MAGNDAGNVALSFETVVVLSVSDTNTRHLAEDGALDIIAAVLTTSTDALAARIAPFRYPVPAARELAAQLLLNLALSGPSSELVLAHPDVSSALETARADAANLSSKARRDAVGGGVPDAAALW